MTSTYKFYQFWLNTADDEAIKLVAIFTLLDKQTIEEFEMKINMRSVEYGIEEERCIQIWQTYLLIKGDELLITFLLLSG